jgi:UDP-3-O-[3-hydroxymyristoyl] glucosamine N-acyltransferase
MTKCDGILTAGRLATHLGSAVEGDASRRILTIAPLDEAGEDAMSWVGHPDYAPRLAHSRAGVVLVTNECPVPAGRTVIRVADPDAALCVALALLSPPSDIIPPGIDPSARVHPDAVAIGAAIGANVCVAAGSVVGEGSQLHPGVCIGSNVHIGRGCVLYPNVVVRERVTLGDRVVIHPNTTIGADGFGYLQRNGGHVKIPQIGTVVIEDDVEIGANCAIDRARSGVTRIGKGTKIDNLVQIAHNVEIGPDCIIVAQCGISGSTRLGRGVMLGGQAAVRDHVQIGDGVMVAGMTGVSKDLASGQFVRGIPAVDNHDFLRQQAALRKLPQLMSQLKALREHVERLEAKSPDD